MPGFSQKINHQETTAERKLRKIVVPIFFILLMLVAVSSWVIGYYIGKTGNTSGFYSGQIIDTIVITPGWKAVGGTSLYRINILGRVLYTDGTPFVNGTVELRGEVRYTTTDSQGYFKFDNVEEGRHIITVLQDSALLASASIKAEKTALIGKAQVVRLSDGSYSIMLPLEIDDIDLVLELTKTGGRHTLDITLNPVQHSSGGNGTADIPGSIPSGEHGGDIPGGDIPGGDDIPGGNIPGGKEPPGTDTGGSGSGNGPNKDTQNLAPGVLVTGETPVSQPWTQTTSVDIFAERPGNSGVRNIDGVNVIAPGAVGKYIFKLKNPENYPLVFNIVLSETDQNTPPLLMRYRLKPSVSGEDYIGGSSWKKASEIKAGSALLAADGEVYYTLEWKWLTTDDATDTALGMQKGNPIYILDIIINAWFE